MFFLLKVSITVSHGILLQAFWPSRGTIKGIFLVLRMPALHSLIHLITLQRASTVDLLWMNLNWVVIVLLTHLIPTRSFQLEVFCVSFPMRVANISVWRMESCCCVSPWGSIQASPLPCYWELTQLKHLIYSLENEAVVSAHQPLQQSPGDPIWVGLFQLLVLETAHSSSSILNRLFLLHITSVCSITSFWKRS